MDPAILGEYALKTALQVALKTAKQVALNIKKFYTSEVDDGITAAFEFALNDWSKHAPTTSDKVRLSKALEGYVQNATSYEALDADTRVFIDCFKKRLSEQPAAHNYLMTLRADMQAKDQEQNLLEHHKTQELIQGLMAQLGGLNMSPQDIQALLKELPLEQGLERTESALEEMCSKGRIPSVRVKQLFLEFVRFHLEEIAKRGEEAKQLRVAGDRYLAESLEEINRVLTGESEQSLTAVHEKCQEQAKQNEIRLLKELIEAALIKFSFGEARDFYERLIELSPTIEHHFNYASLLYSLNDFEKARRHYEMALQELRELSRQNPEAYRSDLARTLNNLGNLLSSTNELKQAQTCYEIVLQGLLELSKQNPEAYKSEVAMTLNNLGTLLCNIGELKQARVCYGMALQIYRELAGQNPEAHKPNLAMTLNNLGNLLSEIKEYNQAQACYIKALQIRRELEELHPEVYKSEVAMTLNCMGNLFRSTNQFRQAQVCYEKALLIFRKLMEKIPEAYKPKVAMALNNLALLYLDLKDEEEVKKAYQEAYDIYQDLASRHPRAYGIDYAQLLVMGFDLLGKPKEYLEEAKATLDKYPEHPKAQELLSSIEELAKR